MGGCMYIIFNDYFLSKKFFNSSYFSSTNVVKCISHLNCKTLFYRLCHVPKIGLIIRGGMLLNPLMHIRKNNNKVLLFGVDTLPDIYLAIKETHSNDVTIWLWNSLPYNINTLFFILSLKILRIRVLTFDQDNAKKLKIGFHKQIYNENLLVKYKDTRKEKTGNADVFFVGVDKGRYSYLEYLNDFFTEFDLGFNCKVIRDSRSIVINEGDNLYSDFLSYDEYLSELSQSYIILDLNKENQTGLTLRVLEALFLKKKLITNNSGIKESKLYNESNVFILEYKNNSVGYREAFKRFVSADFQDHESSVYKEYSLSSFLANIEHR
jgi:hypothetical protein